MDFPLRKINTPNPFVVQGSTVPSFPPLNRPPVSSDSIHSRLCRPTPRSVPLYLLSCLVAQSCPTLCDSMDCSPPGFTVHGDSLGKNTGVGCHFLLQGSSQPRDGTQVSRFAGRFLSVSATREALLVSLKSLQLELPTPAASICLLPPAP